MLFTHLLAGLLVGLAATALGGGPAVLVAGLVGGLLPDLDMFADHRRTLHAPVGFCAVGVPAMLVGLRLDSGAVLAVGTLLMAAWVHSAMDLFGSGRELRPWERTSDRAVYNHVLARWHAPRRFVYDGSPGDFALCLGLGALAVGVGDLTAGRIAIALVVPAALYAFCRRSLAAWIPAEFESLSPYLKHRLRGFVRRLVRFVRGQRVSN